MKQYPKRPDPNMCECGDYITEHEKTNLIFFYWLREGKCAHCLCPKFESEKLEEKV